MEPQWEKLPTIRVIDAGYRLANLPPQRHWRSAPPLVKNFFNLILEKTGAVTHRHGPTERDTVTQAEFQALKAEYGVTDAGPAIVASPVVSATASEATPVIMPATATQPPAPVVTKGASVITNSTKPPRRDSIDPVIEVAQSKCKNPQDTAEVWAQMQVLANDEQPPFLASTANGLKYHKGDKDCYFKRGALDKRLHPEKRGKPAKRR